MPQTPTHSTLFPYTTLFRSLCSRASASASARERLAGTGCWLEETAGQTASQTDNRRCLMEFPGPVVRASPRTRHGDHGYRLQSWTGSGGMGDGGAHVGRESTPVPARNEGARNL